MKKKILITITIVLLPIVTFIAGVYASAWFYNKLLDPYVMSAGEATTTYATLALLQNGETERAMSLLEGNLNSSLIVFSSLDQMKDGEEKEKIKRMLSRIRAYRDQHPYSSENESIEKAVNKALSYGIEN